VQPIIKAKVGLEDLSYRAEIPLKFQYSPEPSDVCISNSFVQGDSASSVSGLLYFPLPQVCVSFLICGIIYFADFVEG